MSETSEKEILDEDQVKWTAPLSSSRDELGLQVK